MISENLFPNILCSCIYGMALLMYLTLKRRDTSNTSSESLPDPSGPLTITMPSGSITAPNSSVAKVLEQAHDIISRAPLRKNKLHGV